MADRCFVIFTRARDCLEASKLSMERVLVVVEVKLLPKFVGPFEVLKPTENSSKNPNNVWLKVPNTLRIHMPINVKDVRRYIGHPQRLDGTQDIDAPLPVTVDGYDMWEIQALLVMRTDKRTHCKQALVL